MPTYTPLCGDYIVLQMDPMMMIENMDSKDDALIDAVKALVPKKYIGYVDLIKDFPLPHRPWHRCHIEFVGQGLPTNTANPFIEPSMCVPISPNTEHPSSRSPLRPTPPFPFDNCYQYSTVEGTVRVLTRTLDPDSATNLSPRDVRYQHACALKDHYQLVALQDAHNRSSEAAGTSEDPEVPIIEDDIVLKLSPSPRQLEVHDETASSSGNVRDTNLDVDDRAVAAPGPEGHCEAHASWRSPSSEGDSSSANTRASGIVATSNESMMSLALEIFGDRPIADPDIIPLVHVSHDLLQVTEIVDPNGFFAERDAIVKLILDARARDRRIFFSIYDKNTQDDMGHGSQADHESGEARPSDDGSVTGERSDSGDVQDGTSVDGHVGDKTSDHERVEGERTDYEGATGNLPGSTHAEGEASIHCTPHKYFDHPSSVPSPLAPQAWYQRLGSSGARAAKKGKTTMCRVLSRAVHAWRTHLCLS